MITTSAMPKKGAKSAQNRPKITPIWANCHGRVTEYGKKRYRDCRVLGAG